MVDQLMFLQPAPFSFLFPGSLQLVANEPRTDSLFPKQLRAFLRLSKAQTVSRLLASFCFFLLFFPFSRLALLQRFLFTPCTVLPQVPDLSFGFRSLPTFASPRRSQPSPQLRFLTLGTLCPVPRGGFCDLPRLKSRSLAVFLPAVWIQHAHFLRPPFSFYFPSLPLGKMSSLGWSAYLRFEGPVKKKPI